MNKEIWKETYKGYYEVSNFGRVRRAKPGNKMTWVGKILSPGITKGYYHLNLYSYKENRDFYLHHLVAEAFLGPRPSGYQVNHKDGNRLNNKPENLEYVTQEQNTKHAIENRLNIFGEKHPNSKLKNSDVIEIRRLLSQNVRVMEICEIFKISYSNVYHIKRRSAWSSLK